MNNIILLLTVGVVGIALLILLITLLVDATMHKDVIKTLKSSHAVLYSKMMALQNEHKFLLKNLDIDEEETTEEETNNDDNGCEVAFITRLAKDAAQRRYPGLNPANPLKDKTFTLIEPDKLEQMRGCVFDTIYIEKDSIKQMNLKEFYDILGPMRAARNTEVKFY